MFYHHRLYYLFLYQHLGSEPPHTGFPDFLAYPSRVVVWAELYFPQASSVGLRAQVQGLEYGGVHLLVFCQL